MSRVIFGLLLLVAGIARADSSVTGGGGKSAPPRKCSFEDGPHWRMSHLLRDQKLEGTANLSFQYGGRAHVLFSNGWSDAKLPKRSVVLDRVTHKVVARVDVQSTALVEDAAGKLVGLLSFQTLERGTTDLSLIDPVSGKARWHVQGLGSGGIDSATTLLDGDQIIVALFHRIATGARLVSVDLKTGTPRFIADVEQMNVGHSEYFNDVSLDKQGSTVLMRGWEAAGCYLQVFELASGRRLSSTIGGRQWNE